MSENLPIISSFLRRRGERSSSSDSVDTTVLQLLMSLLRRPCRRRRIDDDMFRGEVVTSRARVRVPSRTWPRSINRRVSSQNTLVSHGESCKYQYILRK